MRERVDASDEDPWSPERIREILDYKGFATDMHEDVIYVLMSHAPVIVTHIVGSMFIDFYTTLSTKPGSRLRPLLKFVNALNNYSYEARFYLKQRTECWSALDPTITLSQDDIYARSALLSEGGNLYEQLPVAVIKFIENVDFAAREGIRAGLVTLPPRQSLSAARLCRPIDNSTLAHPFHANGIL